jgi:hypothetical protein
VNPMKIGRAMRAYARNKSNLKNLLDCSRREPRR